MALFISGSPWRGTGTGFMSENDGRLFEEDERAAGDDISGTGLGLAIVRELVGPHVTGAGSPSFFHYIAAVALHSRLHTELHVPALGASVHFPNSRVRHRTSASPCGPRNV